MKKVKIRINIERMIDCLCIAYPFLYEMTAMLAESAGRRMSLLMIILLFIGILKNLTKKDLIGIGVILFFILLNAVRFGLHYILHQDFYGMILLLMIFMYYSNKTRLIKLEKSVLNKVFSNTIILLFYVALIVSVIFFHGLQTNVDWGVSIPMLYGPYSLPHTLAYSLIAIYSLSSILWHKYKAKLYLLLMIITSVCLIWTGVRSAILVLVVMLICDYFSIKQKITKMTIIFVGGIMFTYLLFFTDIMVNNPLVQKSIIAAGKRSGITNGRVDFNRYLWDFFNNGTSAVEKVFGISIFELRKYMGKRYGFEIHAHNDLMNTLVGMGIVGFLIYIKYLLNFCTNSSERKLYLCFSFYFY